MLMMDSDRQPARPHDALSTPARAGALAIAGMLLMVSGSASARPRDQDQDCFAQLTGGQTDRIVCEFPVRMTPDELAQVRRATREVLQDANCLMTIDIERRLIDSALAAPDGVFDPPPQPVACEVKTEKSSFPISFTFAPRIEFKGGQAVKASPMMGNVTGVSRILSWPVVTYVNASRQIRDSMLQVVNAYIKHYGHTATAQK